MKIPFLSRSTPKAVVATLALLKLHCIAFFKRKLRFSITITHRCKRAFTQLCFLSFVVLKCVSLLACTFEANGIQWSKSPRVHRKNFFLFVATDQLFVTGIGTCGCCSLAEPEPISYTTEFRDFIQKNAPLDFETKMARVRPFVFTSFIAWPAFWVYRGLDWSNKVHAERSLVTYINRTYHRAKFMQFAILSMGLMFAVYEQTPFFHQVSHMLKASIDDVDEYTAQTRVID